MGVSRRAAQRIARLTELALHRDCRPTVLLGDPNFGRRVHSTEGLALDCGRVSRDLLQAQVMDQAGGQPPLRSYAQMA